MEKPHYLNHRKRLKERFLKAPHAVSDSEIIELMLGYVIRGKDVKPQSKDILSLAKNLSSIFGVKLLSIDGVGSEVKLFFDILHEFMTRSAYLRATEKPISLSNSFHVYDFLKSKIGYSNKEIFIILLLDSRNNLKSYKIIREGFIDNVPISARDIIEESIKNNSLNVIISHNHPTGDYEPSIQDFQVTKEICRALLYTGITLLDHIVVSQNGYYSMYQSGHIEKFYKEVKIQ